MRIVITMSAATLVASPAFAQVGFETSDDGRTTVRTGPGSLVAAGDIVSRGGIGVPFGTTADWELNLRRQVGALQIADMNGDGKDDLIVGCYISNSFPPYDAWRDMIFYNTGTELESSPSWLAANETHTGDIQIGDINGDSFPDVVAIHGGGVRADALEIYFGSATGPSTTAGYASNYARRSWGTSGVIVDMDSDGDLDVVTTNQGIHPDSFRPILLYRNNGSGLATTPDWESAVDEISNGIAAADLLGSDGYPELAVAKWVNWISGVYQNNAGTPGPLPFMDVTHDDTDKGAAVGDIDGDGFPEVAFGGDNTTLYQAVHGALFPIWTANPPFSGPQEIRMHDVDNDGDLDLAEVHFGDGRTHIYLNRDGVLDTDPTWTYDASTVANAIAFGDINGDNRPDLAIGFSGDISVRVFYGQAPACLGDWNGNTLLNTDDFLAYLNDYNAVQGGGSPTYGDPDLAAPFGTLNTADFLAYLNAYNDGC